MSKNIVVDFLVNKFGEYKIGWFSAYDTLKGMVALYGADKVQEALTEIVGELKVSPQRRHMSELEKQAYELCFAIEQLSAGSYATRLSIMASDLLQNIRAAQQSRALDAANVCRVINHFYVDGVCSQCGSKEPPRQ